MNKTKAIQYLYPTAKNGLDFEVTDYGDGVQVITKWNIAGQQPTESEIATAYEAWWAAKPQAPPSIEERTQANEDAINFLLGTVML